MSLLSVLAMASNSARRAGRSAIARSLAAVASALALAAAQAGSFGSRVEAAEASPLGEYRMCITSTLDTVASLWPVDWSVVVASWIS